MGKRDRLGGCLGVLCAAMLAIPRSAHDAVLVSTAAPPESPVSHYRIDQDHASVVARVRCLALLPCALRFHRVVGQYDADPAHPEVSRLSVTVDARSFESAGEAGMRPIAGEILDSGRHPFITFNASGSRLGSPGRGWLTGELTFRGVTRTVSFRLTWRGARTGGQPLACSATAVLKRSDFGSTAWRTIVGDEVRLTVDAPLADQPAG